MTRKDWESQCRPVAPIPAEGTLSRCQHGVYFPNRDPLKPDEPNPYCSLCTPFHSENGKGKKFVLPACGDPLNENDRPRANQHVPSACPACGSFIHTAETYDGSGAWKCADCGNAWTPRGRQKNGKVLVTIRHI